MNRSLLCVCVLFASILSFAQGQPEKKLSEAPMNGTAVPSEVAHALIGTRISDYDEKVKRRIDPSFHGFWILNVEKSDFGGRPKPKLGFVNWGDHGWTFALVTTEGQLYADAVETDHGCTLVGVFPDFSCDIEVVAPNHLRLTMKQVGAVRRVADIELLKDGSTQTTHQVTPSEGAPYVEKTIWEKQ